MFKSLSFQSSTGSFSDPLELTHDKIHDLRTEEDFIARLKKQKHKMEILNSEFQQQDALINDQEQLIKSLTADNTHLQRTLQEYSQRLQTLELESSQKTQQIYSLESSLERMSSELVKVREAYAAEKTFFRESEAKLSEQESLYQRECESLKSSVRSMEKEVQSLRDKYKQKVEETKDLIHSLQLAEKTIIKLHQEIKRFQIEGEHIIQKYEESMDDAHQQNQQLHQDNHTLKTKNSAYSKQLADSQHRYKTLSKELEEAMTASEQKEGQVQKLEGHLRNCVDQIKVLEEDIGDRDHLISGLSSKKESAAKYNNRKRELMSIREKEYSELDSLIESIAKRHC